MQCNHTSIATEIRYPNAMKLETRHNYIKLNLKPDMTSESPCNKICMLG